MADHARTLTIDFSQCAQKTERIYVTFGSTAYQVAGAESDKCVIKFGGEVENPNFNPELTNTCKVPLSVGKQDFVIKDLGIDFSPIEKYCRPEAPVVSELTINKTAIIGISVGLTILVIIISTWFRKLRNKKS